MNDIEEGREPFGGGVARGVEATDWEALKEKAKSLADPMLLWEYDMGRLGRG